MNKIKTPMIMIITAGLLYYFMLPAINIHDIKMWVCLLILIGEFIVLTYGRELEKTINTLSRQRFVKVKTDLPKPLLICLILVCLIIVYMVVTPFIFSPLFMAGRYANRIEVRDVGFDEIPPYNFNTTAIIDRDSASNLGDKVMGQMTDLVSQFVVSNEYSQIDYKQGTYRVTPLAYDGIIKYFRNKSEGVPGYIVVNTTTGETVLNRLEKKMKYVPSAYFNENLMRKLRFAYPFEIFSEPSFEIDEDGNPYYVCTTYTYNGVSALRRVTGVILFDPVDGTSEKYDIDNAPTWIDRIYPESLINEELNDFGLYRNGFLNSFFGQEGVIQTSEGYNYISKEGDIWLYTGMTSIVSDQSNIGFALVNLRTHEAQFITTSGADEYSVMASAEGEVLNYGYTATFPVLVNINSKPTYILSLKDSAGLVKMYALVDARDYQQVYTVKADKDARAAIDELIRNAVGHIENAKIDDYFEKEITITQIKDIVIEGNTYYYLNSEDDLYIAKVDESLAIDLVFANVGDKLLIQYYVEDDINYISSIKKP